MKLSLVAASGLLLVTAAFAAGAGSGAGATSTAGVRQSSVKVIAARRERAASREAKRLLREFVPPPGARRTRQPSEYGGGLRSTGSWPLGEVVDRHAFWRVKTSLKGVAAFVEARRVRGVRARLSVNGPRYLSWDFLWPVRGASRRVLTVTAVPVRGHKVLRVDAKVVWIYPRSPQEKIPAGVRQIVLDAPKVHLNVTGHAKVRRIVRWFDALPISPPGVSAMCGAVPGPDITLSFRSASGRSLASAHLPPIPAGVCDGIAFTLGGHPEAPLIDNYFPHKSFVGRLQRLLGVHLVARS